MGSSMIEQIIQAHTRDEVVPDSIVWMDIDLKTARDFGGANVVEHLERHHSGRQVADPDRTFFTFDTVVPAKTIPYAENQHTIRKYARRMGLKVYDVDAGIGSHIVMEEGIARPGCTMAGTDSHLNILGAIGAFGQGMGDMDIAFIFMTGRTWFEVPRSMLVRVEGEMPEDVTPKDLTLAMAGKLGASGGLGMSIEVVGASVREMSLAGRITVASMATEMGAICSLIEPDERIMGSFPRRKGDPPAPRHDPDHPFERVVEIDASALEPMVSLPGKPDKVVPVRSVKDVVVDSVFIGSCTNGSFEDIANVASIASGRKVRSGVMAMVVPSTRRVWRDLLGAGHIKTLFDAGFIVSNPGCGGCASGQIGMTGVDEVQVSTSNRNFVGKQGSGRTYLASPETAVASAVLGHIATVEELEVA